MGNNAHRQSSSQSTVDLGSLSRTILAWPEDIAQPQAPDGTPPGYGMELWYGTLRERITELVEYRIWTLKGTLLLRVRATPYGALVGIYDAELRDDGTTRPVRQEWREWAIKTAEQCKPTVRDSLELWKSAGKLVTRAKETIPRKARISTPALYEIMYRSMLYCSALVWHNGTDASTYMINWGKPDVDEVRYSKGDKISIAGLLRTIEHGKSSEWWHSLGEASRATLAQSILRKAVSFARQPPPWQWWAGTARRTDGFVMRSLYNGSYVAVGVRCWKNDNRSGIKTVVRRFVRPDDDTQQTLF